MVLLCAVALLRTSCRGSTITQIAPLFSQRIRPKREGSALDALVNPPGRDHARCRS